MSAFCLLASIIQLLLILVYVNVWSAICFLAHNSDSCCWRNPWGQTSSRKTGEQSFCVPWVPSPLSRNLLFVGWKQGASTHTVFAIESLDKVNWSLRVESMLPSHALSFHTHTHFLHLSTNIWNLPGPLSKWFSPRACKTRLTGGSWPGRPPRSESLPAYGHVTTIEHYGIRSAERQVMPQVRYIYNLK